MKYLLIIIILLQSCRVSPNYNVGSSHNESLRVREREVLKQGRRMWRQAKKVKRSSTRESKRGGIKIKKKYS
jgi:hypothetical protein